MSNGPQNNNNKNDNNGKNDKKKKQTLAVIIVAAVITILLSTVLSSALESATTKEVSYDKFCKMVKDDEVEKVIFKDDKIMIHLKDEDENDYVSVTYWTGQLPFNVQDEELMPLLREHKVKYTTQVEDKKSSITTFFLEWILPFALIYMIMGLIFRRVTKNSGGIMGVGKSNAKVYMEKETGVTFVDVAGQEEAKESMNEIVDFLHNPGKYATIGAKLPKGALLVGPPGTGKTLLAKAVAGEAKVPFFSLSGSDFVEMFVGVGASRVRDLFKQAQEAAPCIIFIDEIDAIGKSRDARFGGNDEREQTLNQLLSEMDGFDTSKGIFILAATNRPDVLDKALLRPGRFDRRIIVDRPDLKGRIDILKVHSKGVAMDETVDLKEIALTTSGAVGSDLANMINEAAINAVKNGRNAISQSDLLESVEVVIAGKEKKDRILSPKEKKIVAYHEVGHALVTAVQKNSEPVQKITIVPRTMGSLGYVLQVPEEEKHLKSKDEFIAELVTFFGGRAAEELVFQSVTSGASNDIEQATNIARAMITRYGMSEKFGLMALETVEDQYLTGQTRLNCSDATAAMIDDEVRKMLDKCHDDAKKILSEHRKELDVIANFLYSKETITGKQFMELYKKVQSGEDVSEYLTENDMPENKEN
ncbi:cell division protease FtsH [Lachnospiraceae bacterium RM5]|nr:cell division protease FtsH [Lachnospiraceae bacterium RM5]